MGIKLQETKTQMVRKGMAGFLTDELSGPRAEVISVTSITANPDNAYLIVKLDAKNRLVDLTNDCYSVYGTQGVQGGSINPAKAVYTYTKLD